MTLNRRKQEILLAIIKTHMLTGEPVGSKTLCDMFDFGLSPATLRNEMSELCDLGFLEQPHTSAGRIPSCQGYRLYVNNLMQTPKLTDNLKSTIDSALSTLPPDLEYIPIEATKLLSKITGLTAINTMLITKSTVISRIEVAPLGRRMLMLMLITNEGNSKSRICRTEQNLERDTLNLFVNLLNSAIKGKRIVDITPAYIQTVISSVGVSAFSLIGLMSCLFDIINSMKNSVIDISGESHLFSQLKNDAEAGRLLEYMTHGDSILPILEKANGTVNILFGDETNVAALRPTCMIVTSYGVGNSASGRIGVIGPTRMAYDDIIPSIEYFAKCLGNAINESLCDMEV